MFRKQDQITALGPKLAVWICGGRRGNAIGVIQLAEGRFWTNKDLVGGNKCVSQT